MNNVLSQVHPHTRGIIWLTSELNQATNKYYGPIDYLLNGLLTATLRTTEFNDSHVYLTENFGKKFYIMIMKTASTDHLNNYFGIIKSQLLEGEEILLINQIDGQVNPFKVSSKDKNISLRHII